MRMRKQKGFTLIEISIVLVIIGLLLGGVLKGKSMIDNAKYKSLKGEINAYSTALYSFQDTYKAFPGDFLKASTELNANAKNGSGNGTISGGHCNTDNEESCLVFSHLRYADLISGDRTQVGIGARPNHAYGGLIPGIWFSVYNGVQGHWIELSTIPVHIIQRLDKDLDDGVANTGNIYCSSGCTGGYTAGANGSGNVRLIL